MIDPGALPEPGSPGRKLLPGFCTELGAGAGLAALATMHAPDSDSAMDKVQLSFFKVVSPGTFVSSTLDVIAESGPNTLFQRAY